VSLGFLSAGASGALARSGMEPQAREAGASFEPRDGWNLAVSYPREAGRLEDAVGFGDVSHIRKLSVTGAHGMQLGGSERRGDAVWCPVSASSALVLYGHGTAPADALDVTSSYAAMVIAGPRARDLFARFCALDLRPHAAPLGAFRPGSVARTPGYVLREGGDRFLLLFGWAFGRYMWETIADAAAELGGGPVGVEALTALERDLQHA
jgi:glycine cleavage system aminomethyltransferase T